MIMARKAAFDPVWSKAAFCVHGLTNSTDCILRLGKPQTPSAFGLFIIDSFISWRHFMKIFCSLVLACILFFGLSASASAHFGMVIPSKPAVLEMSDADLVTAVSHESQGF